MKPKDSVKSKMKSMILLNDNRKNVTDEEVERYLFANSLTITDYFLGIRSYGILISYFYKNREYDFMIDDEEFRLACIDYLLRNGVKTETYEEMSKRINEKNSIDNSNPA